MTNPITVQIDKSEIEKQVSIAEIKAISEVYFKIESQEEYDLAQEVLKVVKNKYKELDDKRKSITKPLDDSKKQVMDLFKPYLTELENLEKRIKDAILKFVEEQERKAKEKEEELQKYMIKENAKLKKKTQKELEKALAKGNTEKVEELTEQLRLIDEMPLIIPNFYTPEIEHKSVSFREKWYAEVVDFSALPDEYKIANMQALDKVAQTTRGSAKIPGVIFKMEKIVVTK